MCVQGAYLDAVKGAYVEVVCSSEVERYKV